MKHPHCQTLTPSLSLVPLFISFCTRLSFCHRCGSVPHVRCGERRLRLVLGVQRQRPAGHREHHGSAQPGGCGGTDRLSNPGPQVGNMRIIPPNMIGFHHWMYLVFIIRRMPFNGAFYSHLLRMSYAVSFWITNDHFSSFNISRNMHPYAGIEVIGLSTGWEHTCAVASGGGIWCFGGDNYGQLGTGNTTRTDQLSPSAVSLGAGGFKHYF